MKEVAITVDGKKLIDYMTEKETEITRLEGLVREMGKILHDRDDLDKWAEILSRPEVREIMGGE